MPRDGRPELAVDGAGEQQLELDLGAACVSSPSGARRRRNRPSYRIFNAADCLDRVHDVFEWMEWGIPDHPRFRRGLAKVTGAPQAVIQSFITYGKISLVDGVWRAGRWQRPPRAPGSIWSRSRIRWVDED